MKAVLITPHQLFENHPALGSKSLVYLVSLDYFFKRFSFCKQKLLFHAATLAYYKEYLQKKGHTVIFLTEHEAPTLQDVLTHMKKNKITTIHYAELIEHELEDKLASTAQKMHMQIVSYQTPNFLTSPTLLESFFNRDLKRFHMFHFYRKQRKELNILVNVKGQPYGGSWSFDKLNRESLPPQIEVSEPYQPTPNRYTTHAQKYISKYYPENPGNTDSVFYPTTHAQAKAALKKFLKERLYFFGPYEDALSMHHHVLFHSQLSPLLNVGLLTPHEVIEQTLDYAQHNEVPLSSLEGFIRQIIGWREFIYGIYKFHGQRERETHYLDNKRSMPKALWTGTTGIDPVDHVISKVLTYGYAHHIERLMILGNFMLLLEINPHEVYHWFMELFIDAYDWVMIPNVYGMSQFVDGGLFATKPYISSSAYLKKMGSFKKNPWMKTWDALFWTFIINHQDKLKPYARMAYILSLLKRMKPATLTQYKLHAQDYIKSLKD